MATSNESQTPGNPGFKETVKRDGLQRIETGKQRAASQIEDVADAIDAAGLQLDRSQPTLAGYASQLANGVGQLATRLREGSVEDLSREARAFATRSPVLFVLSSAAVGLLAARFMKASTDPATQESTDSSAEQWDPNRTSYANSSADPYGNPDAGRQYSSTDNSPSSSGGVGRMEH